MPDVVVGLQTSSIVGLVALIGIDQESYFTARSPNVRAPLPARMKGKKPKRLKKANKRAKYLS